MTALEDRLGYTFTDPRHLERALTHRSFANENRDAVDNETYEYLGDAVLDLVIGHALMLSLPEAREGMLSQLRADLVNGDMLALLARELELGPELRLGRGESETGGAEKDSLLADAFEAVVGAIYLDGGFEPARDVIHELFAGPLGEMSAQAPRDYKTRAQEFIQAHHGHTPTYELVEEAGPDHDKWFTVAIVVNGDEWGRGEGRSKKAAEQQAAAVALSARFPDGIAR